MAWQAQAGLPATGQIDAATRERLGTTNGVLAQYVVAVEDVNSLTAVPATWAGKAQMERLGYETVLELVAEKFHAKQALLRRLNPNAPWPNPPAGTTLTVPDPGAPVVPPAAQVRISLGRKLVRAYDEEGRLIAQFPCSIARDREKRPVGKLHVEVVADNPNYLFDPALFVEDPESASIPGKLVIPPGPNNPVGAAWIGLDRTGYGIHGAPHPEDIGETESHGCFRLANWNARKLLGMVSIGTPVVVTP